MTAEFIVAVHSLVFLNHKKKYCSSEEIAENVCTNPARIRKIINKLKKHNMIKTKSGFEGGYLFLGNADKVTLYDVLIAVDEHIASISWRSGNDCAECPISRKMRPIINSVFEEIDIAAAEKLKKISIKDIDEKIFD